MWDTGVQVIWIQWLVPLTMKTWGQCNLFQTESGLTLKSVSGVPVGAELEISQEQTEEFEGSSSSLPQVHFFYSSEKTWCFLFLTCFLSLFQEVLRSDRKRVAAESGLYLFFGFIIVHFFISVRTFNLFLSVWRLPVRPNWGHTCPKEKGGASVRGGGV